MPLVHEHTPPSHRTTQPPCSAACVSLPLYFNVFFPTFTHAHAQQKYSEALFKMLFHLTLRFLRSVTEVVSVFVSFPSARFETGGNWDQNLIIWENSEIQALHSMNTQSHKQKTNTYRKMQLFTEQDKTYNEVTWGPDFLKLQSNTRTYSSIFYCFIWFWFINERASDAALKSLFLISAWS